MADSVRVVETRFIPTDRTSGALQHIAEKAHKADERINELSSSLAFATSAGGSLVAALSLEHVVDKTNEYFTSLKRLKIETGLTADKAAQLKESLELGGGLEGMEAERVLLSMSRKALAFQQAAGAGGGGMRDEMKRLGVDLKKGPEASLLKMAELAERGKISTAQIARGLGVRSTSAVTLMSMLEKGPEAMKEIMAGAMKVSEQDIAQFSHMQQMKREIADAWEDLTVTIGKRLMPAVNRLMEGVKERMDGWFQTADRFGEILGEHLEGALGTVTTIGKVLLANYSLQKMTGKGLIGGGMALGQWLLPGGKLLNPKKAPGPLATTEDGRLTTFSALDREKRMAAATSWEHFDPRMGLQANYLAEKKRIAAIDTVIESKWNRIRGHVGGAMEHIRNGFDRVKPAVEGLFKVGSIGVGLALAAGSIKGMLDSINGVASQSAKNWSEAAENMRMLSALSEQTFGPEGTMSKFLADPMSVAAKVATGALAEREVIARANERLLKMEREAAARAGANMPTDTAWQRMAKWRAEKAAASKVYAETDIEHLRYQIQNEAAEIVAKQKAEARIMKFSLDETKGNREQQPYFDFRGSRFDILQRFEEGFDPDRIAAAFAGDVADLGERAVQSNFAPLFSVHG